MNQSSEKSLYVFIAFLGILNIAFQSFDFLHFQFEPKGYYRFDSHEMNKGSFLLNKLFRTGLNLTILFLVQKNFFQENSSQLLYLVGLIIGLALCDVLLMQESYFLATKLHEFLHPLAFSPLIPLAYWLIKSQNKGKP